MSQNTSSNGLTKSNNKLDNYNPVSILHTDINNLFDDFFNFRMPKLRIETNYPLAPPVEITESAKSFKIRAELAGIDKKDVDITIKDSSIVIKCSREDSLKKEEESYLVREMYYGSYERHIKIPETADLNTAKASFKDGILSINIDKKPESISAERRLEIK